MSHRVDEDDEVVALLARLDFVLPRAGSESLALALREVVDVEIEVTLLGNRAAGPRGRGEVVDLLAADPEMASVLAGWNDVGPPGNVGIARDLPAEKPRVELGQSVAVGAIEDEVVEVRADSHGTSAAERQHEHQRHQFNLVTRCRKSKHEYRGTDHEILCGTKEVTIMGFDDKTENKAQEFQGKAKEFVGEKTGDENLQADGAADQAQSGVKKAAENVKDAAKNIKDGLTGN